MASFGGDEGSSGLEFAGQDSRLGSGEIRYTKLEYLSPDGTPCAKINPTTFRAGIHLHHMTCCIGGFKAIITRRPVYVYLYHL